MNVMERRKLPEYPRGLARDITRMINNGEVAFYNSNITLQSVWNALTGFTNNNTAKQIRLLADEILKEKGLLYLKTNKQN
jgi:hypothetical protein